MFRAGRDQLGIPPPRVNQYRDWNLIVEIRALFSLDGLDGVGASAFFRFRLATDRNNTYLANKNKDSAEPSPSFTVSSISITPPSVGAPDARPPHDRLGNRRRPCAADSAAAVRASHSR